MIGTKILEERESKYNGHLKVVRSLGFGTYIQADGLTQSGGIVEEIWKSTLRKIHSSKFIVRNSLILGLGGGTVAKLIRKNWPASPNRGEPKTKITGIDIDPTMVELGKKYLGLDQINVEIKIHDAYEFTGKFDLIIIDLYNGEHFPEKFGNAEFLSKVKNSLSEQGVVVFNRTYYGDKRPGTVKFGNKLKKIFPDVEWFYPEANLMLICRN
jgi:spermidine synthase